MRWTLRGLFGGSSGDWFDRGLDAKYLHDWPRSLRCNRRAVELDPGNEGAWWNLGIAATALRDWPEARRAWKRFGVEMEQGREEAGSPGQIACVRLNPGTSGEVVWGERIDPARMVLDSVPLPESGHRFRDIVLHDGAANGTREFRGGQVPVFDELIVWQQSEYRTFRVVLEFPDPGAPDVLAAVCTEHELGFEDWSTVRWICAECSRGNPGAHDCTNGATRDGTYASAAKSEADIREALAEWKARVPGAAASEPVEAV